MKAIWNDTLIAESADTIVVEGNHYFPPEAIVKAYFQPSSHTTRCFWKGQAHYYSLCVNAQLNANAAWYYPQPKPRAQHIQGRIAFWKGVKVCT